LCRLTHTLQIWIMWQGRCICTLFCN